MKLGNLKGRAIVAQVLWFVGLLVFTSDALGREEWPAPVEDQQIFWFLLFDQLEYREKDEGPDTLRWDVEGWVGSDYNRIWVKTEGEEQSSGDDGGEAEGEVLYSRLIGPFWDLQVGVRYDALYGAGPNRSRSFAVMGLQGLAPYWFEVETALFISEDGEFSARFTGEYDLLFTQRLVLQPRFEVEAAAQEVREFDVGKGFNDVEVGLRLRYEVRREFAPYAGISWVRKLGDTADMAQDKGEDIDSLAFIAGLRLWF